MRRQHPGGAAQAWCMPLPMPLPMPCLLSGPVLPSAFRIATGHAAVSAAHAVVGLQAHLKGHDHACKSNGHGALDKEHGGDRVWCMLSFLCPKVSDGMKRRQRSGGVPPGCSAREGCGAGGRCADWGAACVSHWGQICWFVLFCATLGLLLLTAWQIPESHHELEYHTLESGH